MAIGGYYRSDGIQNSGTALTSWNRDVSIYNSSGKIYPRQINQDWYIGNAGYYCQTCRSGYNSSEETSAWRTDKAYQGYYDGREGRPLSSYGHFFPSNGVKPNIGGGNIINFSVKRVRIKLNRVRGGYRNRWLTGVMRQSNLINSYKNGIYRGARTSDIYLNNNSITFNWAPYGETTVIDTTDDNWLYFIYNFLADPNVNSLCIHNDEDYGGDYSANYGCCTEFSFEAWGTKLVQL